jgi:hypothetical protein
MSKRVAWCESLEGVRGEGARMASMVGSRVTGGRYVGIDEPTPSGTTFHSADYGLEVDLSGGALWSFIWKTEGYTESLLAYEGAIVGDEVRDDADVAVSPLAASAEWAPYLGRRITSVGSAWDEVELGALCPVTWVIGFEDSSRAVVTLGRADEAGRFARSATDVAVFFGIEAARAVGVVLPSDPTEHQLVRT